MSGLGSIDSQAKEVLRKQRIAELVSELDELGYNGGGNEELQEQFGKEYAESAKLIVQKMHNPQTIHDKIIHTNIPRNILTNMMMMGAIEIGLREIYNGKRIRVDKAKNLVEVLRENEDHSEYVYKKMTYVAYRRCIFYANAMQGINGTLAEELMALDGWRSNQGEGEIGSLVNSENLNLQAKAGNTEVGLLRKAIRKVI